MAVNAAGERLRTMSTRFRAYFDADGEPCRRTLILGCWDGLSLQLEPPIPSVDRSQNMGQAGRGQMWSYVLSIRST